MKEEFDSLWTGWKVMLFTCLLSAVAIFAGGSTAQAAPQYALDCKSCHKMAPLDSADGKKNPVNGAVPGNHQTHAPATNAVAADCVVCHTSGVNAYGNSHLDGTIQLDAGFGYTRTNWASQVPNPGTLGTCSNVNCHSDGAGNFKVTPAWGSTAAPTCTTCHDLARTTGSHAKHASYYGNDSGDDCVNCHNDRTGNFQHAMGGQSAGITLNATVASAFDTGSDQCSNLYCHSNGQATPTYATPTWGGTADCTSCHGDATSGTLSGKHAAHVNNAGVLGTSYGCVDCHDQTVSNNTTISTKANHVDTVKTMSTGFACSTCHQDGKGTAKTASWTAGALDCKGCHGSDNAPAFTSVAGEPNYASTGAGQPGANSHKKHVDNADDCVKCHSGTTTDGLKITGNHTNSQIDVSGAGFSWGADKTCSNINCHSGGGIITDVQPAQWGDTLDCKGCHGDASTLTTNAHAAHVGTKGYACATCHLDTVSSGSTVITGTALHANSSVNVAGSFTFTEADKTCATACHGAATPVWNNPASGACGTCHLTSSLATGAHAAHLVATNGPTADCTVCHPASTDATHVNSTVNLNDGINKVGTCSSCHSASADWTSAASVNCSDCHSGSGSIIDGVPAPLKTVAGTAGHGKASIAKACTDCHDADSAHITGALGQDRLLSALGTGNANCTYCHDSEALVANADMRNMTDHQAATCAACHDPHGTANASMINGNVGGTDVTFDGTAFVNASGTGLCQVCHTSTQYFKQNVADTTHADYSANCLQCHSHKSADSAFAPNRNCDGCHGYPPAPQFVMGNDPYEAGVDFGVASKWLGAKFEDYTGGGGAHLVGAHIPADIDPAVDGWAPCLPCHFDGETAHNRKLPLAINVANVTVKVDTQFKFSADYEITYVKEGTTDPAVRGTETGSCSNVSCHFQPSPKWSLEQ